MRLLWIYHWRSNLFITTQPSIFAYFMNKRLQHFKSFLFNFYFHSSSGIIVEVWRGCESENEKQIIMKTVNYKLYPIHVFPFFNERWKCFSFLCLKLWNFKRSKFANWKSFCIASILPQNPYKLNIIIISSKFGWSFRIMNIERGREDGIYLVSQKRLSAVDEKRKSS